MADTKVTGKAYRICTDATPNAEQFDKISFWTDDADIETNISGTEYSLNDQLSFVSMGTVPLGGGVLSVNSSLFTEDGFIDIYVDDAHSTSVPSSISRSGSTISLTFPSSAVGTQVKVRCWK